MSEQYDLAAIRHLYTGELLVDRGEVDDAGYHFGLCGENAIKHALRTSGVEAGWTSAGLKRRATAMGKHFPSIRGFLLAAQTDVSTYGQGRLAGNLLVELSDPGFASRFDGWSIDIRYADTACTPVPGGRCGSWRQDAEMFVDRLVLA